MHLPSRFPGSVLASLVGCVLLAFMGCARDDDEQDSRSDAGSEHADAARHADAGDEAADASVPADASAATLHDPPAVAAFRAALEAGGYDELPGVLAQLEAASAAQPDDPSVTLALALANLWGVAEIGRLPTPDPAQEATFAFAAQMQLERARELSPDDARIDGWLGSVHIGIGTKTASPALVQTGYDEIARGVERDRAFNLFVQAFQYARKSPGDPEFARAAEAFWATTEVCEFEVGPEQPSLAADAALAAGVSPVCGNGPKMPHNVEGFWIYGGDILLKSGDLETARAFYANAATSDRDGTWPHGAVVDQRLSDASSWAARLADDDAENDPLLAWDSAEQCVLCHAR